MTVRAINGDPAKLRSMLERVLVALARFLIRHSVSYPTFVDIAKKAYVDVATQEYGLRSRPASQSRVALLTGINRRDVARVRAQAADEPKKGLYNPVFSVVSLWMLDPQYQNRVGQRISIPLQGEAPSLEDLRKRCCPDVTEAAVLRELINAGVAEFEEGGVDVLRLRETGYIPKSDTSAMVELMGIDVAALVDTIDGNIRQPDQALFHRKVSFNDVSRSGVAILNALAGVSGQRWLEELDQVLDQHRSSEDGQFAGLGIYVFAEKRPNQSDVSRAEKYLESENK